MAIILLDYLIDIYKMGFVTGKDVVDIFVNTIIAISDLCTLSNYFCHEFLSLMCSMMDGLYWVSRKTGITQREHIWHGLRKY